LLGSADGSTDVSSGPVAGADGSAGSSRPVPALGACADGSAVGVAVADGVGVDVGAPHQDPLSDGNDSSGVDAQPAARTSATVAHTSTDTCFEPRKNVC
jgi:hypothetical protein